MRPSFLPRLLNSGFQDPVLFVPFSFSGQALIFDLGDIHALPPRDILKITHAFVSHTHMDHFCGFDRLLRLFLNRDKTLHLYGPAGFIDNVRGKLAGYTWNLVGETGSRFALKVAEIGDGRVRCQGFACSRRFEPTGPAIASPFGGEICRRKGFSVRAVVLDHSTACLAFALEEPVHVNVIGEALAKLGLTVGPWLGRFKQALLAGFDGGRELVVPASHAGGRDRTFRLEELAGRIARISAGQKIAYVVDAAFSPPNVERMIELCRGADHLFIEAAFLDREREIASRKYHLTARQAGTIAGRAGVARLSVCHFSPRYEGQARLLEDGAQAAFEAAHPAV